MLQHHWGFYIEADRVSALSYNESIHDRLDALKRTNIAREESQKVALACVITLAVQMCLSPGLTPEQWMLFQYAHAGIDMFNAVFLAVCNRAKLETLKKPLLFGKTIQASMDLSAPLVCVLDEAQVLTVRRDCVSSIDEVWCCLFDSIP